jgi:transcriptional/translational regulatory protein YebC/TACO1
MELELIDFGLEEVGTEEGESFIQVAFTDFGKMQQALDSMGIAILSADKERVPMNTKDDLNPEQIAEVEKLIERLEEDEDVQAVFHNMV